MGEIDVREGERGDRGGNIARERLRDTERSYTREGGRVRGERGGREGRERE